MNNPQITPVPSSGATGQAQINAERIKGAYGIMEIGFVGQ